MARSWTPCLASLCNQKPEDSRIHATGLSEECNPLDPITIGIIMVVCLYAVFSTKGSSRLNYVASCVHFVVILFVIVAGLVNADTPIFLKTVVLLSSYMWVRDLILSTNTCFPDSWEHFEVTLALVVADFGASVVITRLVKKCWRTFKTWMYNPSFLFL